MSSVASQDVTSGNTPRTGGAVAVASPAPVVMGLTRDQLAAGVLATGAFLALFWRFFYNQFLHSFDKPDDWGHAFIMPAFVGWLIWRKRDELARCEVSTCWPALAPVLLGIACYVFFNVGFPNHMFQGYALIMAIEALVLLLLGPQVFRRTFLPIACLALGVTISEAVMIKITFPLQLIASKGAWLLMALTQSIGGYTVELNGNTIDITANSGKIIPPMNVAEACSGMRMLIAFYALAAAVALITSNRWWERIAIVLIAAPVAVLMNILRVAVLGWISLVDPAFSVGDAHMLIGTLLLVPALGLYLGAVWACGRIIVEPEVEAKRLERERSQQVRRVATSAPRAGGKA